MGLDFIKDTKKWFEQKRDRHREKELEDEDLITLSVGNNEVELFRCRLTDLSAQIAPGYRLVLRAYSETHIVVSQAGKVIGSVVDSEASRLASFMKSTRVHTGILTVIIVTPPDISNEFLVQPRRSFRKSKK